MHKIQGGTMSKILFIGAGNMAEGIISGLIDEGVYKSNDIYIDELVEARREQMKNSYQVQEHGADFQDYEVIVLAIRPQDFTSVAESLKAKLNEKTIILSVCAGIDLNQMENSMGKNHKFVRVMPNVLIEVKHGYSAACVNDNINDNDKQKVQKILDSLGQTEFISESLFNEFTAFSCAGPAYIMYFMNAMIDAGVQAGFSREMSRKMVCENMIGSAMSIQDGSKHPYQITDSMTSPAGVTIEGLHALNEYGFSGIVQTAVQRAVDKANSF